jgi:signal transduction histidine kinase
MVQELANNPVSAAQLSPADLAELLGAFNEVTVKLQGTHETLRAEVSRLQGELAQANRQLERAQRLASLGEMAAGIAHEVRNPLGSIRLHARMLEQDLGDRPEERGVTRKILAAVEGLDSVVSDVLAFSKEFRVRASVCEASDLLERALDECLAIEQARRAAGGRELPALVVRREDLDSARVVLTCDQVLVHRALANVVRNALQAMTPEAHERGPGPSRRELVVGAREEHVPGSDGGERRMCVLSVADTGPGMTREVLERMFNPFFTTRAAGTGLGLAIVHRIADAHQGLVRVRNREAGTGALVEVLLPVRCGGDETTDDARGSDAPARLGAAGEMVEPPFTADASAGLTERA